MNGIKAIALPVQDLWVIRSLRTTLDKKQIVRYYETPSTWNTMPVKGTIFTSYEAAEGHMIMMRERDLKGTSSIWGDGSIEVFDVVSLIGEVEQLPESKLIRFKKQQE